jgi:hypothetical protein
MMKTNIETTAPARSTLLEFLAPTLQGPVYVRLGANYRLLKIGGEFNLSAEQVERWIDILEAFQERMRKEKPG